MKVTIRCKLSMYDELDDPEVKIVYSVDAIAKDLIKNLKEELSEKGNVYITDYTINVN